jgi:hypothetical protein
MINAEQHLAREIFFVVGFWRQEKNLKTTALT